MFAPTPTTRHGKCAQHWLKAEETGEAPASDAYKQAVIDAIKTEGASVVGITSEAGYTFDANNNPIKDAVIMTITNGEAVYKETF